CLAAAEALASCGDTRAVPALWAALAGQPGPDRFLEHALIHAIHRLASSDVLEDALGRPEPRVRAAVMLLLAQPPGPRGRLGPAPVVVAAASPIPELRRTALGILRRHPEWAGAVLDQIRAEIGASDWSEERRTGLSDLILTYQDQAVVQDLLA